MDKKLLVRLSPHSPVTEISEPHQAAYEKCIFGGQATSSGGSCHLRSESSSVSQKLWNFEASKQFKVHSAMSRQQHSCPDVCLASSMCSHENCGLGPLWLFLVDSMPYFTRGSCKIDDSPTLLPTSLTLWFCTAFTQSCTISILRHTSYLFSVQLILFTASAKISCFVLANVRISNL